MEPGRLRASAVASYLRSALSSASSSSSNERSSTKQTPEQAAALSSSAVSTAPSSDEDEHKSGGAVDAITTDLDAPHTHTDNDLLAAAAADRNDASDCINTLEAADRSSSPRTAYHVTYELPRESSDSCVDDDDNSASGDHITTTTAKQTRPQLQYIDVLLQPDDHGLGLNIKAVSRTNEIQNPSPFIQDTVLVVESFRRLYAHDVGPAEASQQIQRGDILHSIDGDRVHGFEQLVATVNAHTRSTDERPPFVLLRFLRAVQELETTSLEAIALDKRSLVSTEPQTDTHSATKQEQENLTLAAAWLTDPQHMTLLVRELAATNERLQQELVASKLAQEEQRIHLEQLYALYAKTQLERASTLSLPTVSRLRFPRRASKQQQVSGSTGPSTVLPTTASVPASSTVSTTTTALHTELELAVRAEHERLRTHYDLQRRIEMRELVEQHAKELAHVRETMAKKLAMLTRGFDDALARTQAQFEAQIREQAERPSASNSNSNSMETCSCGTWMRLQQELSIHQSLEHGGSSSSGSSNGDTAECLVCALLTDARRNARADSPTGSSSSRSSEADEIASQRIEHVRVLLSEYDGLKHERSERWSALQLSTEKQVEPEQQP